MVNAGHWGERALREIIKDDMNVDKEMEEMKKALVEMDVATKDVQEINRKSAIVIDGLCKVAEDLQGVS